MEFYNPSIIEEAKLSLNATINFAKEIFLSNFKKNNNKNLKYAIKRRTTDNLYMKDYKAPSYQDVDLDGIKNTPVAPYIYDFFKIIKEKIPSKNLSNLYRNADSLKIRLCDFKYNNLLVSLCEGVLSHTSGVYNKAKNIIMIEPNRINRSIFHELLHMSSNYRDNDTLYSGFSQSPINDKTRFVVGNNLNEGYTEVLNKRYFQSDDYHESYPLYYSYASAIEKIVGKAKMEELYFTANLPGLVEELAQYSSMEEASSFIRKTDFYDKDNYLANAYSIYSFLVESYSNKLLSENKDINDIETKKEIISFAGELYYKFQIDGTTYKLDRNEILDNIFEKLSNRQFVDRTK